VPGDVAVCGVDDIGFSGLFRPTLTTVRQPMREMSRLAVDGLKDLSHATRLDARQSVRIRGELVVRMSSGGSRGDDRS
jgi:DNA-binding LacI/PurR family transcriptional regulator